MFLPLLRNHDYNADIKSQLLELGSIFEVHIHFIVEKNSYLFNSHLFYFETEPTMFISCLYFLSCELPSHEHFK